MSKFFAFAIGAFMLVLTICLFFEAPPGKTLPQFMIFMAILVGGLYGLELHRIAVSMERKP